MDEQELEEEKVVTIEGLTKLIEERLSENVQCRECLPNRAPSFVLPRMMTLQEFNQVGPRMGSFSRIGFP